RNALDLVRALLAGGGSGQEARQPADAVFELDERGAQALRQPEAARAVVRRGARGDADARRGHAVRVRTRGLLRRRSPAGDGRLLALDRRRRVDRGRGPRALRHEHGRTPGAARALVAGEEMNMHIVSRSLLALCATAPLAAAGVQDKVTVTWQGK